MASISNVPEQSGNDPPSPQLVISAEVDWITTKIAYHPDGRLVTGSESGAVRVWSSQSGEQEATLMEEKRPRYDPRWYKDYQRRRLWRDQSLGCQISRTGQCMDPRSAVSRDFHLARR